MADGREYLASILFSLGLIMEEPDLFLNEFVAELQDIDEILDSIASTPRCDECGAVDETVDWCGISGMCQDHCTEHDDCFDAMQAANDYDLAYRSKREM